ncbi:MAG: EAL domain-containing protein [Pseudomonadales bacterium]
MNSPSSQRILIVNPAFMLRAQVRKILNSMGYENIDESGDGLDAIRKLGEQKYDLVVTDIDLTNIDAWRLSRLIRSNMLCTEATTRIIILSSTYSERIAEATAKEFEVDRFVPISKIDALPAIISEVLKAPSGELPKSSILVVEDYKDTAELVHRILQHRFDISYAEDGESGLEAWAARHFDIVLLDLMLPRLSGEEVLREILRRKPEQSVVMMTAHGDADKAASLVVAGAVDFIAKPFKAERLRQVCAIAAHREDFVVSNEQFRAKEAALAEEKSKALITLRSIADGVVTTDADCNVDYINPVALGLLGCTAEEIAGKPLTDFYSTYHEISHIPTANLAKRAIAENEVQQSASRTVLKSSVGTEHFVEQQAAPIRNDMGVATGAVLVFRDRTEAKNIEQRLSFHASHDPLTGLYNRDIFDQEVRLALHDAECNNSEHCICHISLSQFNMVNESFGHRVGDKLLQKVARLLQEKVRAPSDVIARIGGDEFGVLLRHCSEEAAQRICEMVAAEFSHNKFEHDGKNFDINAGIGIAAINSETSDLHDMLSAAIAASNLAKERGKNKVAIFSGEDSEIIEKRSEVLYANQLMQAIATDSIQLYQQTISSAHPEIKNSCEILSRIVDENGKIVLPGLYLSAAERYSVTPSLDRWVIKNTFHWLAEHPQILEKLEYISINISGLSICDANFTVFIQNEFKNSSIPSGKICFEITETAAVSNFIRASDFITAVRDLGCKFALDDFGSGMSSFAYLKKLPVDILKIDGLFIRDILNDPIDLEMVKSINDVGHVMGLKTVAEYVENDEILRVLAELGVDSYQGYAISKPQPIQTLLELIEKPAQEHRTAG